MDTTQRSAESPFSNPAGGAKDAAAAYSRALLDLLGDQDIFPHRRQIDRIKRAIGAE